MKYLLAALVSLSTGLAQWEPQQWLTSSNSRKYTSSFDARCIAGHGDTVHVVWYDICLVLPFDSSVVCYRRSLDGGLSWEPQVVLTRDTAVQTQPAIGCASSSLHVVWESHGGNLAGICHVRSTDAGATWASISCLAGDSPHTCNPALAVDDSVVHVAWEDLRHGPRQIYYRRSTDAGRSWESEVRFSSAHDSSHGVTLGVEGRLVVAVWYSFDSEQVCLTRRVSLDRGASWDGESTIQQPDRSTYNPTLAVSGGYVHLAWSGYRRGDLDREIYYLRSTDSGSTWDCGVVLTNDTAVSGAPSIAASGENVHLLWNDNRIGWSVIHYVRSIDAGVTWSTDSAVSSLDCHSYGPSVTTIGGRVHAVWYSKPLEIRNIVHRRNPTGNLVGVGEARESVRDGPGLLCTTVTGCLVVADSCGVALLDVTGRKTLALLPGSNDVSRLAPGVYFIHDGSRHVRRVIVLK